MQQKAHLILALCAALVVTGFFLPWVEVHAGAVGAVSKLLTGKRQSTIDSVSGFRVPIMANGPDARFIISVIKIFNPGIKDADKKSWLIWIVPLFALTLWGMFLVWGKNVWFLWGVCLLGIFIFGVGTYKIATTDLNKVVLNVKIAIGLWMTLCGYLGMGLTSGWLIYVKNVNK